MTRFTLYGANLSPFARKVRVVLAEKGLDYTLVPINIFAPPPDFAEISPLKRIPVLRDDTAGPDATLADSSAIVAYLERIAPNPALLPSMDWDYARALWFEEYGDSELAYNVGMDVFRPRVVSRFMGKPTDEAMVDIALTQKLPRYFAYLDKALEGRDYLVGDKLSIADIAIATHFVNLRHARAIDAIAPYANLSAFVARLHTRASFAAVITEECALIDPLMDRAS